MHALAADDFGHPLTGEWRCGCRCVHLACFPSAGSPGLQPVGWGRQLTVISGSRTGHTYLDIRTFLFP